MSCAIKDLKTVNKKCNNKTTVNVRISSVKDLNKIKTVS